MIPLGYFELTWHGFLRVNSEKKAKSLIQRLGKALDCPLETVSCEPYWKDKALYTIIIKTSLDTADVAIAVLKTLLMNQVIATHWIVSSPTGYADAVWSFQGYADRVSFVGVDWMEFELGNFRADSGERNNRTQRNEQ